MLRIISTIQTRVFDVTEQFLKGKGIDTEEFASQVQYIVQNSVIVHGPASNVCRMSMARARRRLTSKDRVREPHRECP